MGVIKLLEDDDARRPSCKYCNQQPEIRHHTLTYNTLHHFLASFLQWHLKVIGGISENVESQGPIPEMNFGRFMARDEFVRSLQVSMFGKDDLQLDPWIPFRPAIECCNHSRQAGISPGTSLCIEESMCAWRGMSLKVEDMLCGLPHSTKVVRKPEPALNCAGSLAIACMWRNKHYPTA